MFPVQEVCGGKGLTGKCPSSFLCLPMLIIIYRTLVPAGNPSNLTPKSTLILSLFKIFKHTLQGGALTLIFTHFLPF
jgi:hypothetical protein